MAEAVFVQKKNLGLKNFYPGYLGKTSILEIVGAASSRDRFNSRLEAAPTGVFFSNLDLPDKRIFNFQLFLLSDWKKTLSETVKQTMRNISILISILSLAATISCTVISDQVRSEAESPVPFRKLIENADHYNGRMVILGGYILDTKNLASETILKVLQVPFRVGEEPDARDLSQGRFIVYYKGFWDPEVYGKDRAITVAGRVMGSAIEKIGEDRIQYLKIENREIYLWPEYTNLPPYYHRQPYPYYRHRYPYSFWYW